MQRRRNLEVIAGRVNGDGSIAAGDGFTVNRNSAGNYTLRFPDGFRMVSVLMTAAGGGGGVQVFTYNPTATSVSAYTQNTSNVGIDAQFAFVAVGVQT